MVVRMLTSLVGPTVAVTTGDVYACDDATAARFIAAGIAEAIQPEVTETAMVAPKVERAVRPKGKGR